MQRITDLSELNGHEYALVDYGASWCKPCKILYPKLNDIALDYPDVKFLYVDVDVIEGVHIKAMPTVRIMRGDAILSEHVGGNSYDDIITALNAIPRKVQINNDF